MPGNVCSGSSVHSRATHLASGLPIRVGGREILNLQSYLMLNSPAELSFSIDIVMTLDTGNYLLDIRSWKGTRAF